MVAHSCSRYSSRRCGCGGGGGAGETSLANANACFMGCLRNQLHELVGVLNSTHEKGPSGADQQQQPVPRVWRTISVIEM